ncbi:MAG: hypothetical protein ABTQ73_14045 [Caldilineales bacterium]
MKLKHQILSLSVSFGVTMLLVMTLLATAILVPLPALADGTVGGSPNPIGAQYGAPRAIDGDADAACADTQDRGDIMDFHAFSAPATNGSRWFFAFVIDSNAAMASGTIDSPTYFVILDDPDSTGANSTDTIPFYNSVGSGYSGDWRRNMLAPGTHFIGCYPLNNNDLSCDLYDNYKQQVANVDAWTVNTITLADRRYVETALPDDADVPGYLLDNTTINTMVISTYNSDNWANPIDAAGGVAPGFSCHNSAKEGGSAKTFVAGDLLATAANCNTTGRPTSGATNDRQCLSLPARTTTTALTDIATCTAANVGVLVDGSSSGDNYTLLTEAGFAGPYQGGDTAASDFLGESSSYRYCNASGVCTGHSGADMEKISVRGDAYFLYLYVEGTLASFGGSAGGSDLANLYVAIDLPDVTSGSAETSSTGVPGSDEFSNAPASRMVNFKGWDVDYAVELIWYGNAGDTNAAKLYDYTGTRTWSSTNFTVVASKDTVDHTSSTPPTAGNLYYGRSGDNYEFAIPWAALGYTAWTAGTPQPTCSGTCRPATAGIIRMGAYTTADSNAVSGEENWDVYDQAPGIGQGGSGLGSHERIGDEWLDTDDNRTTSGEYDGSPYSGATRNTSDKSSSDPDGADVDTIESYFQYTLAPNDASCILAITLASFEASGAADHIALAWETVSELNNRGFNLYRSTSPAAPAQQLNAALIPSQAQGSGGGFLYTWNDSAGLVEGQTYWYWLEDVDINGRATLHGPVSAMLQGPTAVELSSLQTASRAGTLPAWLLVSLLAVLTLGAVVWRERRNTVR